MEKEGNDLPQFECVGLKQGKQASLKSTNSEPYQVRIQVYTIKVSPW